MDSPYDAPENTVAPELGRSFRRFIGWACFAVSAFAAVVLFLSFMGCSLYLYINIGSHDLIFGGGIGVLHTAIAPHQDMTELANDPILESFGGLPGYWHTDILKLGPFHLFAEPPAESFQPFRFDFVSDAEYTALEFPLLILISVFGSLGWRLLRASRVT
jgi:hypothetical protein